MKSDAGRAAEPPETTATETPELPRSDGAKRGEGHTPAPAEAGLLGARSSRSDGSDDAGPKSAAPERAVRFGLGFGFGLGFAPRSATAEDTDDFHEVTRAAERSNSRACSAGDSDENHDDDRADALIREDAGATDVETC